MMKEEDKLDRDEAQASLESIEAMQKAGYRRAIPQRWFGACVACFIGGLFALYAMEDPYPYIVFPIVGLGVFIVAAREKIGAYGREFPGSKGSRWASILFVAMLLLLFFGSIFIRRAYDLAWVPLMVGLLVAILVFLVSESERRSLIAKAGTGRSK